MVTVQNLGLFAKQPHQHRPSEGRQKAWASSPREVREAIAEYKRFNTRGAKAAYADHWIGVWSKDFQYAWPVVYELLNLIEEDELYKDPRRVGPGAPGENHGDKPGYPTFADYFTDRVRQPFDKWAELEATYQYARRHAPEIFDRPYAEAATAAKRVALAAEATKPGDKLASDGSVHPGNARQFAAHSQKSRSEANGVSERTLRKLDHLAAHRPDLLAEVQAQRVSASRAYDEARGQVRTELDKLRAQWKRCSAAERATFLSEVMR